jgi:hypothetical protein
MMMAAGVALLAAGLLGFLATLHFRGLRYFDRPALARHPAFDRSLAAVPWILIPAGLALLARASATAGMAAAGTLAIAWAWRRFVRSLAFQSWLMRRDYEALRRGRPGAAAGDLLRLLLMRRHPEWGEELIDQMARDYPTIMEMSVMTARMERGFRGFRGGIRRAAARSGPGSRS